MPPYVHMCQHSWKKFLESGVFDGVKNPVVLFGRCISSCFLAEKVDDLLREICCVRQQVFLCISLHTCRCSHQRYQWCIYLFMVLIATQCVFK